MEKFDMKYFQRFIVHLIPFILVEKNVSKLEALPLVVLDEVGDY